MGQSIIAGQSQEIYAAVILTFAATFLLVLGVMDVVRRRRDVKRRTVATRQTVFNSGGEPGSNLDSRSPLYRSLSITSSLLAGVERQANEKRTEASQIRRELVRAGYFGPNSVAWYQSIRLGLLFSFTLAAVIITTLYFPELRTQWKGIAIATAAALGFLIPSRYIAHRQKQILEQCRNGFPDFIDLLVICAEAGLSPRAAIDRLSREIAVTYPYLGANLYLANLEIRAGSGLHEALFNLGKRTRVEEASTLASLLQQTEQLGTSISDALRVYSDEMRERRLVKAEKRAHELPVKLVIPLGFFVFPVILVVILLPVVIRIQKAFF
jgi:tight adherence protein C